MTHIKQTDQEITVIGHAGYDKPGKDIVCAGISAIATTLIATLEEIGTDMTYTVESGDIKIRFNKELTSDERLLTGSFLIGVAKIAEVHPDHVEIVQA